jgi:hypothetical protein
MAAGNIWSQLSNQEESLEVIIQSPEKVQHALHVLQALGERNDQKFVVDTLRHYRNLSTTERSKLLEKRHRLNASSSRGAVIA